MNALLEVREKARRELNCAICMKAPMKETQVFSCLEHHLICLDCSKCNLEFCLVCKQSFKETPQTRNFLAEKMILKLF
jgi:hypothetical protein